MGHTGVLQSRETEMLKNMGPENLKSIETESMKKLKFKYTNRETESM